MRDEKPERALPLLVPPLALYIGLVAMWLGAQAPVPTRVALILGHAALLAPFLLSAAAFRLSPGDAFGLRAVTARGAILSVVCGAALWVGSAGLLELQYSVWPAPPEVLEFFQKLHAKLDLWPPWSGALSLFAIAVWPAVVEEIAFRGALQGALRRWTGDIVAVAVSAALFALIHIPPGGYRVPFTLALGAALGALRVRTGSIVPGIVAHAVLNATTVVVSAALDTPEDPTPTISIAAAASALFVSALVSTVAARAIPNRAWVKIGE
jgi:membrane protease YdiL (CAAX protease family)